MSLKYFGTDGIRGTYGTHPITESFAAKAAKGVSSYLKTIENRPSATLSIAIGRDGRASGRSLTEALTDVFLSEGIAVYDLGIIPTPQIAFAVQELGATIGISITASHNPACDNGLKFFKSTGTKFSSQEELELESHFDQPTNSSSTERASTHVCNHIKTLYFDKLRSAFSNLKLQGMKAVVDTANGATCHTTPEFLTSFGVEIQQIGNQPNGQNINDGIGSEHPEVLCKQVLSSNADFGIAHDGDGDRVILVDAEGEIISGEHFIGIIAKYSPTIAATNQRPLVTTSMSNFALNNYMKENDIEVIRTDVGDRNVAYSMFENNSLFGGENSGHYICSDILETGDGLVALLKLFEAVQNSGKSLVDLRNEMELYPSKLLNLKVKEKLPLDSLKILSEAIHKAETEIEGKGRVMLRYSGTENKLRILVECDTTDKLEKLIADLDTAARQDLCVT